MDSLNFYSKTEIWKYKKIRSIKSMILYQNKKNTLKKTNNQTIEIKK